MRIDPRKILIAALLLGMMLPLLQRQMQMVQEEALHGWFPETPKPHARLSSWFSGTLQDSLLQYASSTSGFKNTLFRLHNQYYYSLYGMAKANGVIVGKEYFLYDRKHIQAYTGQDFIGEPATLQRFQKLSELQRIWKQKGIYFQLVMVPGKATAMPEYLPSGIPARGLVTNYERHRILADSLHIPCLDLVPWFAERKGTDPHPLYPAGGIHWSQYCVALAADTLAAFTAALTSQPISRPHIDSLRHAPAEEGEDGDVARGMNLLYPLPDRAAVYPSIGWKPAEKKLKVLTIGDSFFFHFHTHYAYHMYQGSQFFFYFDQLYGQADQEVKSSAEVDLLQAIESQNLIQLFAADANLDQFGWGFIEAAWDLYFDPEKRAPQLERIKAGIRQDSTWMGQVAQKAIHAQVSTEEMIQRDAIWVLQNLRVNP